MAAGSSEIQLLKKFGRHAWRMSWVLLAIQVAATAAGIAGFKFIPRQYSSSTTIRVERQQMANPLSSPQRGAETSGIEDRVRGLREEILSRDYFDKVITRLGLEKPGTTQLQHEGLVQQMIKDTEIVTRQRDADTFQITYTGSEPQVVRDVTNLLAGIFIEDSLANKTGDAGSAVEFLQGQLEIYRKKLEESEAALRQFEEKHVDQVPTTRAAQLARVEQVRTTLSEVQNSLKQARLQRELLRQRVAGAAGVSSGAGAGEQMQIPNPIQAQIREKEGQLRRLLLDYSESYPDVAGLRADIEQLQKELAAHPTVPAGQAPASGPSLVQDALAYSQLERLEVEVSTLTTREEQLQRELLRLEKKVQGIPEVEQELSRLKRDYDVNNDIYNNFLRRLEEARVSKDLETSKKGEVFRILQAAPLPLTPIRPSKIQTLLGGIGAGLALNVVLVFLLAHLDTSFQSAEDARALLGLRVLAGIPRYESPKKKTAAVIKSSVLGVLLVAYGAGIAAFLFWQKLTAILHGGK